MPNAVFNILYLAVVNWIVSPQNSYIKELTPMWLFGDRVSREVIKSHNGGVLFNRTNILTRNEKTPECKCAALLTHSRLLSLSLSPLNVYTKKRPCEDKMRKDCLQDEEKELPDINLAGTLNLHSSIQNCENLNLLFKLTSLCFCYDNPGWQNRLWYHKWFAAVINIQNVAVALELYDG